MLPFGKRTKVGIIQKKSGFGCSFFLKTAVMTILEKREKVLNLKEELQNIISAGEAEQRELKEEETSRLAELRSEIDALEGEIASEEAENRKMAENKEIKTNKKMEKEVRLYDLIKGVALGETLSDEQRQYVNGTKINYRATIQAQGEAGTGIENVPEDKKSLDVAIRNASVLNKLGATWFGNAVGDISIPKYSGSQVGWKGEIETAASGEGTFTEVILQPKRLTAVVKVSKTFLAQDSNDAEAILIRDLADAVAEKLDMTIFGAESGTTERPEGLFYNSGYTSTGDTLSAITYNDVLDLELGVEEHNGTNFVFVASPQVKYALKGTQMASGLQMVYSANEIDGYKAIVSNSVVRGGVIAMDPRDLAVATWNGIEITVDPYTLAADNQIRLVVNYFVDAKLRGDRIAAAIFE